jgi:hypothetical protein
MDDALGNPYQCHSTGKLTAELDNEDVKYLAFLVVIRGNVLHHSSSGPYSREWDLMALLS